MSMAGLLGLVVAAYIGVGAGGASPRPSVDELLVFGLGSSDQMVMKISRVSEGKPAEGCVRPRCRCWSDEGEGVRDRDSGREFATSAGEIE